MSPQSMRMTTDEERLSQDFTKMIAEGKDRLPGGGGGAQGRYIDVPGQNENGTVRPAARRTTRPVARTPPRRQGPDAEQGLTSPIPGVPEEVEEILLPQDLESATPDETADDIDMREAIEQPVPEDNPYDVLELRDKQNKAGEKRKTNRCSDGSPARIISVVLRGDGTFVVDVELRCKSCVPHKQVPRSGAVCTTTKRRHLRRTSRSID